MKGVRINDQTAFQSTLPVKGATYVDLMLISLLFISIHAPREGSDGCSSIISRKTGEFQSTLPVKGATGKTLSQERLQMISIHAPREGSDGLDQQETVNNLGKFQSTLPVKGATLSGIKI